MSKSRLSPDLYPTLPLPSWPPTWADIERLARDYPMARQAVVMVDRGDATREQALILLACGIAHMFSRMFRAEVDRLNCELPRWLILPPDRGSR